MLPTVCDERLEHALEPGWGDGMVFQPEIRPTALFNCALWVVALKAIVTLLSDQDDGMKDGERAWFLKPNSEFDDALVFARNEDEADDLCGDFDAIRRRWNQSIIAMNRAFQIRADPFQEIPAFYRRTFEVSGSTGSSTDVEWVKEVTSKNLLKITIYRYKLEIICRSKLFIFRRGRYFDWNHSANKDEWKDLDDDRSGVSSFESLLSLDSACPNGAGCWG